MDTQKMEVVVEFEYVAVEDDELTIRRGDVITNVVVLSDGWMEGSLDGRHGAFPDNFVKEVKKEDKPKEVKPAKEAAVKKAAGGHVADLANKLGHQGIKMGPPPINGAAKVTKRDQPRRRLRAKVAFSYTPANDDELRLDAGDFVEVLKQEEEGWWEGTINGKTGMFPSNFVELVQLEEAEEKPQQPPPVVTNDKDGKKKFAKVMGPGLGDIFKDGPINLRPTGELNKAERTEPKPVPPPTIPPEAERPAVLTSSLKKTPSLKQPPALPPKDVTENKKHSDEWLPVDAKFRSQCATPLSSSSSAHHLASIPEISDIVSKLKSSTRVPQRDGTMSEMSDRFVYSDGDHIYTHGGEKFEHTSPDSKGCTFNPTLDDQYNFSAGSMELLSPTCLFEQDLRSPMSDLKYGSVNDHFMDGRRSAVSKISSDSDVPLNMSEISRTKTTPPPKLRFRKRRVKSTSNSATGHPAQKTLIRSVSEPDKLPAMHPCRVPAMRRVAWPTSTNLYDKQIAHQLCDLNSSASAEYLLQAKPDEYMLAMDTVACGAKECTLEGCEIEHLTLESKTQSGTRNKSVSFIPKDSIINNAPVPSSGKMGKETRISPRVGQVGRKFTPINVQNVTDSVKLKKDNLKPGRWGSIVYANNEEIEMVEDFPGTPKLKRQRKSFRKSISQRISSAISLGLKRSKAVLQAWQTENYIPAEMQISVDEKSVMPKERDGTEAELYIEEVFVSHRPFDSELLERESPERKGSDKASPSQEPIKALLERNACIKESISGVDIGLAISKSGPLLESAKKAGDGLKKNASEWRKHVLILNENVSEPALEPMMPRQEVSQLDVSRKERVETELSREEPISVINLVSPTNKTVVDIPAAFKFNEQGSPMQVNDVPELPINQEIMDGNTYVRMSEVEPTYLKNLKQMERVSPSAQQLTKRYCLFQKGSMSKSMELFGASSISSNVDNFEHHKTSSPLLSDKYAHFTTRKEPETVMNTMVVSEEQGPDEEEEDLQKRDKKRKSGKRFSILSGFRTWFRHVPSHGLTQIETSDMKDTSADVDVHKAREIEKERRRKRKTFRLWRLKKSGDVSTLPPSSDMGSSKPWDTDGTTWGIKPIDIGGTMPMGLDHTKPKKTSIFGILRRRFSMKRSVKINDVNANVNSEPPQTNAAKRQNLLSTLAGYKVHAKHPSVSTVATLSPPQESHGNFLLDFQIPYESNKGNDCTHLEMSHQSQISRNINNMSKVESSAKGEETCVACRVPGNAPKLSRKLTVKRAFQLPDDDHSFDNQDSENFNSTLFNTEIVLRQKSQRKKTKHCDVDTDSDMDEGIEDEVTLDDYGVVDDLNQFAEEKKLEYAAEISVQDAMWNASGDGQKKSFGSHMHLNQLVWMQPVPKQAAEQNLTQKDIRQSAAAVAAPVMIDVPEKASIEYKEHSRECKLPYYRMMKENFHDLSVEDQTGNDCSSELNTDNNSVTFSPVTHFVESYIRKNKQQPSVLTRPSLSSPSEGHLEVHHGDKKSLEIDGHEYTHLDMSCRSQMISRDMTDMCVADFSAKSGAMWAAGSVPGNTPDLSRTQLVKSASNLPHQDHRLDIQDLDDSGDSLCKTEMVVKHKITRKKTQCCDVDTLFRCADEHIENEEVLNLDDCVIVDVNEFNEEKSLEDTTEMNVQDAICYWNNMNMSDACEVEYSPECQEMPLSRNVPRSTPNLPRELVVRSASHLPHLNHIFNNQDFGAFSDTLSKTEVLALYKSARKNTQDGDEGTLFSCVDEGIENEVVVNLDDYVVVDDWNQFVEEKKLEVSVEMFLQDAIWYASGDGQKEMFDSSACFNQSICREQTFKKANEQKLTPNDISQTAAAVAVKVLKVVSPKASLEYEEQSGAHELSYYRMMTENFHNLSSEGQIENDCSTGSELTTPQLTTQVVNQLCSHHPENKITGCISYEDTQVSADDNVDALSITDFGAQSPLGRDPNCRVAGSYIFVKSPWDATRNMQKFKSASAIKNSTPKEGTPKWINLNASAIGVVTQCCKPRCEDKPAGSMFFENLQLSADDDLKAPSITELGQQLPVRGDPNSRVAGSYFFNTSPRDATRNMKKVKSASVVKNSTPKERTPKWINLNASATRVVTQCCRRYSEDKPAGSMFCGNLQLSADDDLKAPSITELGQQPPVRGDLDSRMAGSYFFIKGPRDAMRNVKVKSESITKNNTPKERMPKWINWNASCTGDVAQSCRWYSEDKPAGSMFYGDLQLSTADDVEALSITYDVQSPVRWDPNRQVAGSYFFIKNSWDAMKNMAVKPAFMIKNSMLKKVTPKQMTRCTSTSWWINAKDFSTNTAFQPV